MTRGLSASVAICAALSVALPTLPAQAQGSPAARSAEKPRAPAAAPKTAVPPPPPKDDAGPEAGSYRIQPGDVLEVAVAGIADLRQRVTVGVDGEIAYPMIGHLKVAGLPLQEIRDTLRAIIPTKIYQMRATDGRELTIHVLEEEITVAVAEYRPIYLSGDVAKPGEQVFRPGMTVRQAVALAGGFDVMRFRMQNPFLEAADLRAEYESLWIEFARDQAKASRLQAELDGRPAPAPQQKGAELPVPPQVRTEIAAVEAQQYQLRTTDAARERTYLDQALAQAREQLASLDDRAAKENEGADADEKDLERVRELFQRGTVPMTRLTDARRYTLMSATMFLQTSVQATQARQKVGEIGRQIQKTEDQRRMDILADLQDVKVRMASTRARIEAVGEKLLYTGAVKTQVVRGKANRPDIVIHRRGESGDEQIVADENAALQPGDVVDIALAVELPPDEASAPTRQPAPKVSAP